MATKRDHKTYLNYFRRWDGAGMLGILLMAYGFLCLWLGRSLASYIQTVLFIPVGIAVYLYGSIGRATEADFTNDIERQMERINFRGIDEEPRFRRRVPKEPKEQCFSGFSIRPGVLLKRRKSGELCSSEYICAKMLTLTDAYYIKCVTFSFVSDERREEIHEICFDQLEETSIERTSETVTVGKKNLLAKTCMLCLTYNGGQKVMLPVKDDIYAEEFAASFRK